MVILVVVPAIDLVAGLDRSNPPDDVIEALEQDRYYRWITYLFLPIQYVGFVGAMYLIAHGDPLGIGGDLSVFEKVGLAVSIGASAASASTPPTSSGTRRRATSAGCPRSPWPELLRPLLHRAQPRPPRPGRDAGGPGQQPGGRELLPVLDPHGRPAR